LFNKATAIELTDIPQMDMGAPLPLVIASDSQLVLSYLLNGDSCALVTFEFAYMHRLGSPNDETLHGHPLYKAGLRCYMAFRITDSPLILELQKMNSVHRYHDPEEFKKLNHYVFTFHDSTFECVATSYRITVEATEMIADRFELMTRGLRAEQERIRIPSELQ
jgi:hypothetical protein